LLRRDAERRVSAPPSDLGRVSAWLPEQEDEEEREGEHAGQHKEPGVEGPDESLGVEA